MVEDQIPRMCDKQRWVIDRPDIQRSKVVKAQHLGGCAPEWSQDCSLGHWQCWQRIDCIRIVERWPKPGNVTRFVVISVRVHNFPQFTGIMSVDVCKCFCTALSNKLSNLYRNYMMSTSSLQLRWMIVSLLPSVHSYSLVSFVGWSLFNFWLQENFNLKHIADAPLDRPDPQSAWDKERLKVLRKRCKKLRLRLTQRWDFPAHILII